MLLTSQCTVVCHNNALSALYQAIYISGYLSTQLFIYLDWISKSVSNSVPMDCTEASLFYSLQMLVNTLSGQARQWTFPGSPRSPWRTCGWRCWAWWAEPPATPCSSDSQPTSYSPSTHPGANTGLPSEDFWEVFDQFLLGPVGRVKIMKHQKDHEVNSNGLIIQFSFWRISFSLTVKKLFLRQS